MSQIQFLGLQEWPEVTDDSKATDVIGTVVPAVPVERAADLGTLQDPKQARSLGQKHWLHKKGVLTGIIGRAMNKSTLDEYKDQ